LILPCPIYPALLGKKGKIKKRYPRDRKVTKWENLLKRKSPVPSLSKSLQGKNPERRIDNNNLPISSEIRLTAF
jgi:hypothetical protein